MKVYILDVLITLAQLWIVIDIYPLDCLGSHNDPMFMAIRITSLSGLMGLSERITR